MENSKNLAMAPSISEKSTIKNQESELTLRRSFHLPNELWLKIINYMKTKDIFGSFALVNKHFNSLTLDTSAIKYLQVKNIRGDPSKHENVMKVLSRCKSMIEFSIEDRRCDEYQFKSCINKALESSQKLKSLKILTRSLNLGIDEIYTPKSGALDAADRMFVECLEKLKDKLENIEFENGNLLYTVLDAICITKNLKRLAIKKGLFRAKYFIYNLANSENQLEEIELHYPLEEGEEEALIELFLKKQEKLKSVILKSHDCFPIFVRCHFPKLEKIYMYSSQATTKLETKHLEQFLAQSANLKSIEFDGHFNIDIANEYLYQIIKDRNIFIIFSRNPGKKIRRNLLDTKQSSLEDFLRQDPFVHAKYQTMKKQNSILSDNDTTSDTDDIIIFVPKTPNSMATRSETPTPKTDNGVPNYILYLLFTLFASGYFFILLAMFWFLGWARISFISMWPLGLCLLIILGSICLLSLTFLIYFKCKM